MAMVSGSVFYDETRLFQSSKPIANIPIALYDPETNSGAIALTDAYGSFNFLNVPNSNYFLIECFGAMGSTSPIDYSINRKPMIMPTEADPPITILNNPTLNGNKLNSITPNLYKISVSYNDVRKDFYDAPFEEKSLNFSHCALINENLINPNKQLIVNYEGRNTTLFSDTINVLENKFYALTFWVSNLLKDFSSLCKSYIKVNITSLDNTLIYSKVLDNLLKSNTPERIQLGVAFNSDTYSKLKIEILTEDSDMTTNYIIDNLELKEILFDENINIKEEITNYNNSILEYRTVISNMSNSILEGLTFKNALTNNLNFNLGSVIINNFNNNLEDLNPIYGFKLPNVPAKESLVITFTVTINSNIENPSSIVNNFEISYPFLESSNGDILYYSVVKNTISNCNINSNDLLSNYLNKCDTLINLNVDKTIANINDELTYTITIKNTIDLPVTNLFFKSVISNNITFIPGSLTINGSNEGLNNVNPVKGFTLQDLGKDSILVINFKVLVYSLNYGLIISNMANITGKVDNDIYYPIDIDSNVSNTTINNTSYNNIITNTTNKEVTHNKDILTSTIDMSNPNIEFTLGDAQYSVNCDMDFATTVIDLPNTWECQQNNSYSQDKIIESSKTYIQESISNTVSVEIEDGSTCITDEKNDPTSVKLIVKKIVNKTSSYVSDTLIYAVIITNTSTLPLINVFFKDNLQDNIAFTPGSVKVNGCDTGFEAANPITGFNLNNISAGGSVTIIFTVTVENMPDDNIIKNTCTVSGILGTSSLENIASNTVETTILNNS